MRRPRTGKGDEEPELKNACTCDTVTAYLYLGIKTRELASIRISDRTASPFQTKHVQNLTYSTKHHTVSYYGHLWFRVTSNSRHGLLHFVDLQPSDEYRARCSCEAWECHERPCRHWRSCVEAFAVFSGVHPDLLDEYMERMIYAFHMGVVFRKAWESPMIQTLLNEKPKTKDDHRLHQDVPRLYPRD